MHDFSSKKLIEDPQKYKISSSFELCNKKVINEIYNQLNEMVSADSITIQELND